jgi:hypothetical protein
MKQLFFEFMNDPKFKKIKESSLSNEVELNENQLIQEANALADVHLNISGKDALCMAARGDFYGTDLEESILHSNLLRIISLLGL